MPRPPHPVRLAAGDGTPLAGTLWPGRPGAAGVVVVHGAGSRKESHADFAERLAAAGLAALALDLRGHGGSGGAPGPGMVGDVLAACDALARAGAPAVGLRGSSLGGFLALHAAARHPAVRACVAICPATPATLVRALGDAWPLGMPLEPVVARPDGVARGYWHATGDDRVPWGATFALWGATPQPRALRIALGGGHRTLQHDPAVQAATVAFLAAHLVGG